MSGTELVNERPQNVIPEAHLLSLSLSLWVCVHVQEGMHLWCHVLPSSLFGTQQSAPTGPWHPLYLLLLLCGLVQSHIFVLLAPYLHCCLHATLTGRCMCLRWGWGLHRSDRGCFRRLSPLGHSLAQSLHFYQVILFWIGHLSSGHYLHYHNTLQCSYHQSNNGILLVQLVNLDEWSMGSIGVIFRCKSIPNYKAQRVL